MRKLLILSSYLFFGFIYSCSQEKDYLVSGTLQQATVAEWQTATPENQLSTCYDFIGGARQYTNNKLMREDARNVMNCINDAIKKDTTVTKNTKVVDIGAGCVVLLKVNEKKKPKL